MNLVVVKLFQQLILLQLPETILSIHLQLLEKVFLEIMVDICSTKN